ncbi:MAG TPA: acyl-CoA dehydrogenase family protein [Actinopolymorphaceae bacterium]
MDDLVDFLGIDAFLTEEERASRDLVRRYGDEHLRPNVARWFDQEISRSEARDVLRGLAGIGLLGMQLSGYGCAGAGPVSYGLAMLELEAVDSGLRSMASVQGSLAMMAIHTFGSEEQKSRWLPGMASGEVIGCFGLTEPDVGSDPASMRTVARRSGSDWVLDGTKMWITNGGIADIAVVWARTDEGIRGFVVPADSAGLTINDVPRKMSMRVSITSELVFDGVRVPQDALLPGSRGLRSALACLNEARFGIVFGAMGAARDAFACARSYAMTRQQFGRAIAGFQLTQGKLADMLVELEKGILLAVHLGRLKERGLLQPAQVSFGKLNNTRVALDICRTARTILGASGVTLDYPVMRHASNLESVVTYEGTSEVHTLVLGQALTGLDAFR